MENRHDRRISLLAQSSFSICLLVLISGLLVFPIVFLHRSDTPAFWRWSVRWLAVVGTYTLILAVLILLCWRLLSLDIGALQIIVGNLLRAPYDNAVWVAAFIVSIPASSYLVRVLGTNASLAIKILGGLGLFWFFLFWILVAGLYWPILKSVLRIAQPWFVGVGVAVAVVLCIEGYLRIYDLVFKRADGHVETGASDRFLGEEGTSWQLAYWEEFKASSAMQWTPYLYWRRKPFRGEFINIDERGVRRTLSPRDPVDTRVHFFGGSTAWGTGARDGHTIPSEIVALLQEQGIAAEVTNFGESSYITRQDAMLFQFQLQQGNIPDIAIFYWGYNDTYYAWKPGYIGLPGNESNRVAEFQFGRRARWDLPPNAAFISLLYDTTLGSRLLSTLGIPDIQLDSTTVDTSALGRLEDANLLLTIYPGQDADDLAGYFASMMAQVQQIARLYDVKVVFVWQPVPYMKDPLCSHEREYLEAFLKEHPGLDTLYQEVDSAIRDHAQSHDHVLIMSDLFRGHKECVFVDYIHITEAGNRAVAKQIVSYLLGSSNDDQGNK
jgi:lysophospholipase L1-like esterase